MKERLDTIESRMDTVIHRALHVGKRFAAALTRYRSNISAISNSDMLTIERCMTAQEFAVGQMEAVSAVLEEEASEQEKSQ